MSRWALAILACLALVLAAAGSADASFASFRTPSRNIGCIYDSSPAYLRCDIRSGLKPRPSRPKRCGLDFGDSVSLARHGRTALVCHGDTAILPQAPVLRYGTTWRRGPLTCISQTAGLTCRNADGHGFFLSRESWRRY